MADNSTNSGPPLPDSLNLPPHLSAHKYFFVCTLTVAAWDTLVLSPRSYRLLRTKEWPLLKIAFHFLRVFMPVEFTIVGVAFFDTKWSLDSCHKFFLFEPICTAILLAVCSLVHVVRIHAIYEKSRAILTPMGVLLGLQIVLTAICCAFFRTTPVKEGQGCIASPKHNWVGLYWVAPTALYTASFLLALNRSFRSLQVKPISYWKLMLRDGLNLYGAIWIVNMVNMLFWFIITPTGPEDPIRTIVTSMAAVLTTSMTLRIILSVRGSLAKGGSFAVSSAHSQSHPSTHVISGQRSVGGPVLSLQQPSQGPYNVPLGSDGKANDWTDDKASDAIVEAKGEGVYPVDAASIPPELDEGPRGVKVTIDTEIDYGRK
ncbi:hypothetical protein BDY19DRAFT_894697 [Irpex rosettiformis]|uniref:Uncharacterized protein n=1 Tax=Irpex rosettiformis TaxID=378272 RepID=A0ACB8TX63_9APHY|nr:hypothetical protein BDY19DRAFT_894697 [Irpex rosettiformis]